MSLASCQRLLSQGLWPFYLSQAQAGGLKIVLLARHKQVLVKALKGHKIIATGATHATILPHPFRFWLFAYYPLIFTPRHLFIPLSCYG